jgi:transposase
MINILSELVATEALMRGDKPAQTYAFTYISAEERVPAEHPLRRVKKIADQALSGMSRQFDKMYSSNGRPSIPPESLLKAQLLIALYSVRSDRLFCEMLDYNILFRWFLDIDLDAESFDASTFSKNRMRLIEHEIGRRFLAQIVGIAKQWGLLSDEHFTVDGTLVEAWASLKSFRDKSSSSSDDAPDDPGNPTVNFHGERRSNTTHQSTTDGEALLARKGPGKEARLSYSANILMENRHGLCVGMRVQAATGTAERDAAAALLRGHKRLSKAMRTVGADKGYHTRDFVKQVRGLGMIPHIATIKKRRTEGLDRRTTRHESYRVSQRVRKKVEEFFGWGKSIGGLRKTRYRGTERVREHGFMVAAAYDLLRLAKLAPEPCLLS